MSQARIRQILQEMADQQLYGRGIVGGGRKKKRPSRRGGCGDLYPLGMGIYGGAAKYSHLVPMVDRYGNEVLTKAGKQKKCRIPIEYSVVQKSAARSDAAKAHYESGNALSQIVHLARQLYDPNKMYWKDAIRLASQEYNRRKEEEEIEIPVMKKKQKKRKAT